MSLVTQADIDEYYRKKEERKARKRQLYQKNKAKVIERQRKYQQKYKYEIKQRMIESWLRLCKENPEKVEEIKRKKREYDKKRYQNEKLKLITKCLKQNQVAKIGVEPTHT